MAAPDPLPAFLAAFNARDVDAMAALVHPEVQIHGGRGLFEGEAGLRRWIGEPLEHLTSELELRHVADGGGVVVLEGVKRYRWREDGTLADEHPTAAVVGLNSGLISRWEYFPDIDQALASASLSRVARP